MEIAHTIMSVVIGLFALFGLGVAIVITYFIISWR